MRRWLLTSVALLLAASALGVAQTAKQFSAYTLATAVTDNDLLLLDQKNSNGTYTTKTVKRPALFGGRVFYLSQLSGVYGDASLSDPTVGHDDSAAVQAAITAAPSGSTFVVNGVFRLGNISLPSGTTITGYGGTYNPATGAFPRTGVMQAANTYCVFRNANWVSNYNGGTPVYDFSTVTDRDIMIDHLFINGNRGTGGASNAAGGSAGHDVISGADQWASPSQLHISPVLFYGVKSWCMENVFIYDPGRVGVTVGTTDGAALKNITVFDPATYAGTSPLTTTDGIFVTGNNRGITIDGLFGYVSGSSLSVYSDDAYTASAYNPIKYTGPITDLAIRRHRMSGNSTSLPCCEFASGSATSVSIIDRVSFRDCVFQCGSAFFRTYAGGSGSPNSAVGRISFENIFVQRTSSFQSDVIRLGATIQEVTVRDVHQIVAGAEPVLATVTVTNGNSIDVLNVDRVFVDDTSTVSSVGSTAIVSIGSSVLLKSLRVSNVCWLRTQTPTGGAAVVQVGGNGVGSVELSNVRADNLKNLVTFSGSRSVDNLTLSGITHTNAQGVASVAVPTGCTVGRLRAAGSNTALLTSTAGTGAITSKKTDATEDS